MSIIKKNRHYQIFGEEVEELESLNNVVGMVKYYRYFGTQFGSFLKSKTPNW